MNQALHPVETVDWCVYALFIQDEERIKRDCSMNFKPRKANMAKFRRLLVGSKFFSRRKDAN